MATIIQHDGTEHVIFPMDWREGISLEELQKLVEGDIELLNLRSGYLMIVNANGKRAKLFANEKATRYAREAGIAQDEYVFGDVVVCFKSEMECWQRVHRPNLLPFTAIEPIKLWGCIEGDKLVAAFIYQHEGVDYARRGGSALEVSPIEGLWKRR